MSFIPVSEESHFPIDNLPFGIFSSSNKVSNYFVVLILSCKQLFALFFDHFFW